MGIRVNFTDTGDVSPREPVPAGKYLVTCTDGEIKESGPQAKNPGSQYINWEFTIEDEGYEGRKLWSNTTLLPHALFSIKQLLEAVGMDTSGELDFDLDDVIGKKLILRVTKKPARTLDDGREVDESNEVKSFIRADSVLAQTGAATSKNNLLP